MARHTAKVPLRTDAAEILLRRQIADAIHSLRGRRISERAVHDARKSIKKSRATLRLLRDALPDEEYRAVNEGLRDASAPLGARRDAKILIDVLESLVDGRGDARLRMVAQRMRHVLQRERRNLLRVSRTDSSPQTIIDLLRIQRRRVAGWSIPEGGRPVLCLGIRRTYRHGRRCLRAIHGNVSAEELHEWRKHVKYLWHQLQVLEPLSPQVMREFAHQAHKLSDYLGDDHDLFVLRQKVCTHLTENERGRGTLLATIDRRRKRLQRKSSALGAKVYEEKPHAFAARLDRYSKAWNQEATARGA